MDGGTGFWVRRPRCTSTNVRDSGECVRGERTRSDRCNRCHLRTDARGDLSRTRSARPRTELTPKPPSTIRPARQRRPASRCCRAEEALRTDPASDRPSAETIVRPEHERQDDRGGGIEKPRKNSSRANSNDRPAGLALVSSLKDLADQRRTLGRLWAPDVSRSNPVAVQHQFAREAARHTADRAMSGSKSRYRRKRSGEGLDRDRRVNDSLSALVSVRQR